MHHGNLSRIMETDKKRFRIVRAQISKGVEGEKKRFQSHDV
jgi:hypothetical protein